MSEQQIIDAITNLTTTLSTQMQGALMLIALMVAGTFLVNAITSYRRAQRENKETDGYGLVIKRITESENKRSERDLKEIERQREVIERQRAIIEEQQKTADKQAAVTQENLKAIQEHNRLQMEAARMAEERDEKVRDDLLKMQANLAGGVSLAEENNEMLKRLSAKVETLPKIIADAVNPSVDELRKIVESVNTLTTEIHQRVEGAAGIEKRIGELQTQIVTAFEKLSERIDGLSKIQIEPPTKHPIVFEEKKEEEKPDEAL